MNIAIVGVGGMGTVHHQNYAHVPDARVVAVVGTTDADREKAAVWKLPIYPSIPSLAARESVDLIDICAPTFLHKQLALEAIASGAHVIVEKPVALTAADAREMFAAADARGVQLYVAQVLQFTREVEILREVVDGGRYGRPLDACFERLSARPKWSSGSWLLDPKKSGVLPFDLHIHDLDVIVSAFGTPRGMSFTSCGAGPSRDQYRFTYDYGDLHVSAEAAWFNAAIPFTARFRVYFERGMLIHDGAQLIGYGEDGLDQVYDTAEPIKIPTGINLPPTGMFLRELTHFVGCARQGVPSTRVPREQVLDVLAVLEGISTGDSRLT